MSCGIAIHTKKAKNITSTTVDTGGEDIIASEPVLERGLVWSKEKDPTIFSILKKVIGAGRSDFDYTIIGLIPGEAYYIRTYALNDLGVVYGNTIIINTLNPINGGTTGCITYFNVIMPGTAYIIPAGASLVSVTDKSYLTSSCGSELIVDPLKCYGVIYCTGDTGGAATGNFEDINWKGLIVQGVKMPFATEPRSIDTGETAAGLVAAEIIAEINKLPITLQGAIKDVKFCEAHEGDGSGDNRGTCTILSFRALKSVGDGMKLWASITPAEDDQDYSAEILFPVYTKQEMSDVNAVTLCGCPEEEIT